MRLLIELFDSENKPITLPIHYNYLIQSAIYATLDNTFAEFLHYIGFDGGGRRFKLFTFSRLAGEYIFNSETGEITFTSPVKLVVSSPVDKFCESLMNGILAKDSLRIGKNNLRIQSVRAERPLLVDEKNENSKKQVHVKTLSPVVAYSTMLRPEGIKYTCFFQPGESEFSRLVNENLRKKYQALYGAVSPEGEVEIKSLRQPKLQIIKYKNFVIKSYSGTFAMSGPAPLIQLAVDAGLGAKNSMGFGLLEIKERRNHLINLK